jgi:hypothetical protein
MPIGENRFWSLNWERRDSIFERKMLSLSGDLGADFGSRRVQLFNAKLDLQIINDASQLFK